MKKKANKEAQQLLKKKITALTADDMAHLEKPLGTSTRPFPMWGSQRVELDNHASLEQVLSVIADDSSYMKVFSDRDYQDVVALAYCDMPVPSMLPLFFDGLERRHPESTNRTQMMIGDPGHGKSFLGALQGRLRSAGPVEVYDCGGKNMNDLLFEMVLDFGAGDALPKAIDKRIAAGTLEPLSSALLKGKQGVTMEGDEIVSIDWEGLKSAGTDKVQELYDVLKKVSSIEGLDNAGGNALGMNSQYGSLIKAFMEGREIVLDEYNKSREGSDNALQTVWQFMIGEITECTVDNPLKNKDSTAGPSQFTFRREDTALGFFVTLTGNKTEDGVTTRSLNKSVYSRLSPDTLPDPDVIDWQHRICQMMVGMPVSTLYVAFQEKADANPDEFGKWLLSLRRAKAKVEGVPVPELQETLLSNWKKVVSASENLALFYNRWSELTDNEKITSNGNADLVEEVDDEYTKKEGIDFRKIKQHLQEAIAIRPRMQKEDAPRMLDMGSWSKMPKLGDKIEENPSLHFGTRLTEFLERKVYEKSEAVGKKKLYQKLQKAMEEYSLRDITLQEAARSKKQSVEQSLNISAFADRDMKKQAKMAQKIFCDYIRQVEPEIKATDDQIVTDKKVLDALQYVAARDTAALTELFVVNRNHETLGQDPVVGVLLKDTAIYDRDNREMDFTAGDLVDHDDFLAALALPTVGEKNLSSIWEQNLRPLLNMKSEKPATAGAPLTIDDALLMAENLSATGIAITTLSVASKESDKSVSIHIVRNAARGKTLVVSEKVPSKLQAAFREAGIIHIDRREANAEAKVEAAINDITRGLKPEEKGRLTDAFKYRNDTVDFYPKGDNTPLAKLLVDGRIEVPLPKYVVKNIWKAAS